MTERVGPVSLIRSRLGRVYRHARNTIDRVLHPGRHTRALERVRRILPRSILVICYGNVCRSPYLEVVLARALPGARVTSAGMVGAGRPVPEHSTVIASRKGLDLSQHRSRLISPGMARQADLVIVMDTRQAAYMRSGYGVPSARLVVAGDLDPSPGTMRAIEDPWRKSAAAFEATFARLDRCAESLVTVVTAQIGRAHV